MGCQTVGLLGSGNPGGFNTFLAVDGSMLLFLRGLLIQYRGVFQERPAGTKFEEIHFEVRDSLVEENLRHRGSWLTEWTEGVVLVTILRCLQNAKQVDNLILI